MQAPRTGLAKAMNDSPLREKRAGRGAYFFGFFAPVRLAVLDAVRAVDLAAAVRAEAAVFDLAARAGFFAAVSAFVFDPRLRRGARGPRGSGAAAAAAPPFFAGGPAASRSARSVTACSSVNFVRTRPLGDGRVHAPCFTYGP